MTGDKRPGVKWSGPEGSRPITLADFEKAPGLLRSLFGGSDRSAESRSDPPLTCRVTAEKGRER